MMSIRLSLRLAALLLPLVLSAMPVSAQTDDPGAQPAAKPKKAKDQSELEARVQQLERQMLDMQVVIGTLESMSRQGGDASAGAALGSDAEARLEALETQLQALAAEVRALGGRTVSSTSVAPAAAATDAGDFVAVTPDESGAGGDTITIDGDLSAPSTDAIGTMLENGGQTAAATADTPTSDAGTAEATPKEGIDASDLGSLEGTDAAAPAETDVAALPAAGTPEEAYEEAYGHLLQQDYEAAEVGFKSFLKAYPKSKLAGNAQYWLGESFYVRGNYKQAADAFLTGYKNHRKSQKAPDSLMKLAMSLSRLGEKEASCSAFAALESDFPKLQPQLLRRAQSEKQRAGC
jgi:tol-pal system protein YbgF